MLRLKSLITCRNEVGYIMEGPKDIHFLGFTDAFGHHGVEAFETFECIKVYVLNSPSTSQ